MKNQFYQTWGGGRLFLNTKKHFLLLSLIYMYIYRCSLWQEIGLLQFSGTPACVIIHGFPVQIKCFLRQQSLNSANTEGLNHRSAHCNSKVDNSSLPWKFSSDSEKIHQHVRAVSHLHKPESLIWKRTGRWSQRKLITLQNNEIIGKEMSSSMFTDQGI